VFRSNQDKVHPMVCSLYLIRACEVSVHCGPNAQFHSGRCSTHRHGPTAQTVLHTHLVPHPARDLLLAEPPDPR
jgi:hypothetical protein